MTDPEVFIVRIWRRLAGGFRASARHVADEETIFFSQPADVVRFLGRRVEPNFDPSDTEALPVPRDAIP